MGVTSKTSVQEAVRSPQIPSEWFQVWGLRLVSRNIRVPGVPIPEQLPIIQVFLYQVTQDIHHIFLLEKTAWRWCRL